MIILDIAEGYRYYMKSEIGEVYKRCDSFDEHKYDFSFIRQQYKNRAFKIYFKYKILDKIENEEGDDDCEEQLLFALEIMRAIAKCTAIAVRDASLEGSIVGVYQVISNADHSNYQVNLLSSTKWVEDSVKVGEAAMIREMVETIYKKTKSLNRRLVIIQNYNSQLTRRLNKGFEKAT